MKPATEGAEDPACRGLPRGSEDSKAGCSVDPDGGTGVRDAGRDASPDNKAAHLLCHLSLHFVACSLEETKPLVEVDARARKWCTRCTWAWYDALVGAGLLASDRNERSGTDKDKILSLVHR